MKLAQHKFANVPPVRFRRESNLVGNPVVRIFWETEPSSTISLKRFNELFEVIEVSV